MKMVTDVVQYLSILRLSTLSFPIIIQSTMARANKDDTVGPAKGLED